MEARIQARVHHAIHVGVHRLCLGSRSVVAERHPGFPSRRPSDAGELAMDLVRHHADEPNPNGDRTTIGGSASRALLVKWNSLHAVRTGLGAAATLSFLWALA